MGQGFSLDNSSGDRDGGRGNRLADEFYRDWPEQTAADPTENGMQSPLRGEQADWGDHADLGDRADLGELDGAGGHRGPIPQEHTPQHPDAFRRAKYWLADMWAQHRNVLLVVLGLAVGIAAFAGWSRLNSPPSSASFPNEAIGSLIPFAEPVVTTAPPKPVVVHITGAVASPGVYQLTSADRMFNLVEAAGGFLQTADRGALNLAQTLADGTHVCVPTFEAVETAGNNAAVGDDGERAREGGGEESADVSATVDDATGMKAGDAADRATASKSNPTPCRTQPIQIQSSKSATALIDPNTASAIELERLNGIGPAMSARIVEWREQNGDFRTVDDLLAIPGIGPATLDRFRSQLSLP